MKKMLDLKDIRVNSFVTGMETRRLRGGQSCECELPTGKICRNVCQTIRDFC